jgi:hypothetical protein
MEEVLRRPKKLRKELIVKGGIRLSTYEVCYQESRSRFEEIL